MSLYERRNLLKILAALPLAGCGYTPLLEKGSAARALQGDLRFNLIESSDGFALLEALETRFGRPRENARFDVSVALTITDRALVLNTTGLERHTLSGKAEIRVLSRRTGDVLFHDVLRQTAGYTASAQTLVTRASERAARQRLVGLLADAVALRLESTARSWAR